MAHNVLPLFWNLASSSKDVRLTASADLVSSLEGFQDAFIASQGDKSPGSDDEEDDDGDELDGGASRTVNGKKGRDMDEDDKKEESESDEESGVEVDASDEEDGDDGEGVELDKALAKKNAEDVVYTVKRLVRGLASSRESSRLGFAVALTEVRLL
jgi:DNA polymerase phi